MARSVGGETLIRRWCTHVDFIVFRSSYATSLHSQAFLTRTIYIGHVSNLGHHRCDLSPIRAGT